MKKQVIILPIILILLFCSCAKSPPSNTNAGAVTADQKKEGIVYTSKVQKEDCSLCNKKGHSLLPAYAGQKNLGIICINTFDISPVEINRYDDAGNLIEKPSESFSITHNGFNEGEMNTHVMPNSDRGYASVDVRFTEDVAVDKEAAEGLLCSECLTAIMDEAWDEPYGIGVINFETLEVRLFEENITGFTFGDYYIDIDRNEKNDDSDEIDLDLLIFYCPPRYE